MDFASGFLFGLIQAFLLHFFVSWLYRVTMEKKFGPVLFWTRILVNFAFQLLYLLPAPGRTVSLRFGVLVGVTLALFVFVPLLAPEKRNSDGDRI